MKLRRLLGLAVLMLATSANTHAGTDCEQRQPSPQDQALAVETALAVRDLLEQTAPAAALVARVGSDLSQHGLVYSHVGFAVRDHVAGRWTVVHLLNTCGSDRSGLFAQGLVNFFADDLLRFDARVTLLSSPAAEQVAMLLKSRRIHVLHQSHYSVIARPDSQRFQNSTSWVLEIIAAALAPSTSTRADVQRQLVGEGFIADEITIPYAKRVLGGLFAANAAFSDHSLATRLGGRYPVVTVRAIERHLRRLDRISKQWEWRHGRWSTSVGPA
ncbi:MAG: DUF2145 domain-containing protein [Pseudomarimonas sp.]